MSLPTPDPATLVAYRRDLIAAGLPSKLADQIVLDAAAATHRSTATADGAPAPDANQWTDSDIDVMAAAPAPSAPPSSRG